MADGLFDFPNPLQGFNFSSMGMNPLAGLNFNPQNTNAFSQYLLQMGRPMARAQQQANPYQQSTDALIRQLSQPSTRQNFQNLMGRFGFGPQSLGTQGARYTTPSGALPAGIPTSAPSNLPVQAQAATGSPPGLPVQADLSQWPTNAADYGGGVLGFAAEPDNTRAPINPYGLNPSFGLLGGNPYFGGWT